MLFIGLALVVAAAIVLLISADAGSMIGLTQNQTAQLVPLVIILIVFAGGLFARRHRAAELVGGLMLWMGIFAAVMVGYSYRDDILGVVSRVTGELRPGMAMVDSNTGTATFRRGLGGHFEVNSNINGHVTPMIFDTGASAVVLTHDDAQKRRACAIPCPCPPPMGAAWRRARGSKCWKWAGLSGAMSRRS